MGYLSQVSPFSTFSNQQFLNGLHKFPWGSLLLSRCHAIQYQINDQVNVKLHYPLLSRYVFSTKLAMFCWHCDTCSEDNLMKIPKRLPRFLLSSKWVSILYKQQCHMQTLWPQNEPTKMQQLKHRQTERQNNKNTHRQTKWQKHRQKERQKEKYKRQTERKNDKNTNRKKDK